jgi:hypothetical protein
MALDRNEEAAAVAHFSVAGDELRFLPAVLYRFFIANRAGEPLPADVRAALIKELRSSGGAFPFRERPEGMEYFWDVIANERVADEVEACFAWAKVLARNGLERVAFDVGRHLEALGYARAAELAPASEGDAGEGTTSLEDIDPTPREARVICERLLAAIGEFRGRHGPHGELNPRNIHWRDGRIVIDWPGVRSGQEWKFFKRQRGNVDVDEFAFARLCFAMFDHRRLLKPAVVFSELRLAVITALDPAKDVRNENVKKRCARIEEFCEGKSGQSVGQLFEEIRGLN